MKEKTLSPEWTLSFLQQEGCEGDPQAPWSPGSDAWAPEVGWEPQRGSTVGPAPLCSPLLFSKVYHVEWASLRKGKTSALVSEEETWPRTGLVHIQNHIVIKVGTRSSLNSSLPLFLSFSPSLFSSLFWSHIPIFWNHCKATKQAPELRFCSCRLGVMLKSGPVFSLGQLSLLQGCAGWIHLLVPVSLKHPLLPLASSSQPGCAHRHILAVPRICFITTGQHWPRTSCCYQITRTVTEEVSIWRFTYTPR